MGVKLTVYGSPLCGDCVETERVFQERGIEYEFVNITESMANLKAFLAFRDQDERFEYDLRGEKEDRRGNVKFDLNVGIDNTRVGVTANVGYDTKGENLRGGLGLRDRITKYTDYV